MTSSARIANLDLVLGIILPNTRHLDYAPNDCGSALFEELCNQHEVLLRRNLHQKDKLVRRRQFLPSFIIFHVHPESVRAQG